MYATAGFSGLLKQMKNLRFFVQFFIKDFLDQYL